MLDITTLNLFVDPPLIKALLLHFKNFYNIVQVTFLRYNQFYAAHNPKWLCYYQMYKYVIIKMYGAQTVSDLYREDLLFLGSE